jgi:hypothetical protein
MVTGWRGVRSARTARGRPLLIQGLRLLITTVLAQKQSLTVSWNAYITFWICQEFWLTQLRREIFSLWAHSEYVIDVLRDTVLTKLTEPRPATQWPVKLSLQTVPTLEAFLKRRTLTSVLLALKTKWGLIIFGLAQVMPLARRLGATWFSKLSNALNARWISGILRQDGTLRLGKNALSSLLLQIQLQPRSMLSSQIVPILLAYICWSVSWLWRCAKGGGQNNFGLRRMDGKLPLT